MTAWLALFTLLVLPVCAILGGIATWALARNQDPDDNTLLRHFLVSTTLLLLVSAAVPRTDWFRSRYDPAVKTAKVIAAQPATVALREHKPWDWGKLEAQVKGEAAAGVPQEQTLAYVRTQQIALARHYLAWSPGRTVLRYGAATLAALKELQPTNPRACVWLAWRRAGTVPDVAPLLSAAVASGYEEALAEVFRRADLSHGAGERFIQEHPDNAFAPMDQVPLAYRSITAGLQERHGAVAGMLQSEAVSQADPAAACAATIDLLATVLQQDPKLAHPMLRNLLRS